MPSPFPGMDPWLERPGVFPDLHTRFLTTLSAELNRQLPPPFFAAISTRVYMEESERRVEPDVDILASEWPIGGGGGTAVSPIAVTDLLEVPTLPLPDDEITEALIEIRTAAEGERLVTSIEVLSPTNKTRGTSGRGLYLAKQHELQSAGVNLVEIDLLRRGAHATAVSLPELRRRAGRTDYHVCITLAARVDARFVAPIPLRQRLPVIPIPLTPDMAAVRVDLQATFDRCYDEALYSRRVHYDRPCDPSLTDDQQSWAEGVLRAKGVLPTAKHSEQL